MNFFDNLVLPQSLEHSTLLHFLRVVVLFVFLPYLSILTGGFLLSLFFGRKKINNEPAAAKLSVKVMNLTSINKSAGIALAIAPVLLLSITSLQIHHATANPAAKLFLISFMVMVCAVTTLFTYRYAKDDAQLLLTSAHEPEIAKKVRNLQALAGKSGKFGVAFIFLAVFFLCGGFAAGVENVSGATDSGVFSIFSNIAVYLRFLSFIALSILLAAAFLLFRLFYWEGGDDAADAEIKEFASKELPAKLFVSLGAFTVLSVNNTLLFKGYALSSNVFFAALISLFFLFAAAHFVYGIMKLGQERHSAAVFILLIGALFFSILADCAALVSATNKNSLLLAVKYEEAKKEWEKAAGGGATLSGLEIYNLRCSSCHKFDVKLVGPPYKETLPKYAGDINKLIAFVKNPVKINPAYPPMPNLGLKPAEIRAVSKYILEEYKKK